MIGIIGAMDEEIISLKRKMHVREQREIARMEFFIGTVGEKEVVAVRSGSGKVNAAVCTQILIDIFNVEYIINTGVAGALNPSLNIGDIVVSSDIVHQNLLNVATVAAEGLKGNHKVHVGRIASDDEFICSVRVKEDIYTTFTAYCAEMEGAAIAHTCFLNEIPFVVIRTISDKADPSTDMNFEDFVDVMARNSSKVIESILKTL